MDSTATTTSGSADCLAAMAAGRRLRCDSIAIAAIGAEDYISRRNAAEAEARTVRATIADARAWIKHGSLVDSGDVEQELPTSKAKGIASEAPALDAAWTDFHRVKAERWAEQCAKLTEAQRDAEAESRKRADIEQAKPAEADKERLAQEAAAPKERIKAEREKRAKEGRAGGVMAGVYSAEHLADLFLNGLSPDECETLLLGGYVVGFMDELFRKGVLEPRHIRKFLMTQDSEARSVPGGARGIP